MDFPVFFQVTQKVEIYGHKEPELKQIYVNTDDISYLYENVIVLKNGEKIKNLCESADEIVNIFIEHYHN